MFKMFKRKTRNRKKLFVGIFSESPLKTSFYEELQKNGWCDITDDQPDDLPKLISISIKKTVRV